MVQVGFEFDKRPMREIYKAMQLIDKKQQLRKKCKMCQLMNCMNT